jgi:hypothetical protein
MVPQIARQAGTGFVFWGQGVAMRCRARLLKALPGEGGPFALARHRSATGDRPGRCELCGLEYVVCLRLATRAWNQSSTSRSRPGCAYAKPT